MKDTRYIELKKENYNILNSLTGDYFRIGNIYIKKARGYAVKNIDTEMKINDCLRKLEDYTIRRVDSHSVILDESKFIEEHVNMLSKQVKDPNRYKTIIALSLIIIFIIAWVVISIWMRRVTPNDEPQNLKITKISDSEVLFSWDEVVFAEEGYYVWMKDDTGYIYGKYHTLKLEYKFEIEKGKTYTFYIETKETTLLGKSKTVSIEYKEPLN